MFIPRVAIGNARKKLKKTKFLLHAHIQKIIGFKNNPAIYDNVDTYM